jgi:hypothetical protein
MSKLAKRYLAAGLFYGAFWMGAWFFRGVTEEAWYYVPLSVTFVTMAIAGVVLFASTFEQEG